MDSYSDFSAQGNPGFSDDPFAEVPFEDVPFEEAAPAPVIGQGDIQWEQPSDLPALTIPQQPADDGTSPSPAGSETGTESGQEAVEATEAEEERKRAEHEAKEAERKAAFDARQAAKKKAYDDQLARLNNMTDDEVMAAAAERAGKDTEIITRKNMKDCVNEYIQTLCLSDPDFARLAMHPRKKMVHCFQYITRKAWEYIQDELKADGIQPGPGAAGYGAAVPEDLCYQWAEDYFRDPTVKEDEEEEEKFVPKPYSGKPAPKSKAKKSAEKKKTEKKTLEKKAGAKKPADEGQLSFGQMVMI